MSFSSGELFLLFSPSSFMMPSPTLAIQTHSWWSFWSSPLPCLLIKSWQADLQRALKPVLHMPLLSISIYSLTTSHHAVSIPFLPVSLPPAYPISGQLSKFVQKNYSQIQLWSWCFLICRFLWLSNGSWMKFKLINCPSKPSLSLLPTHTPPLVSISLEHMTHTWFT